MCFQVGGLGEALATPFVRTRKRLISRVNALVRTQVEIQRKSFATPFEFALHHKSHACPWEHEPEKAFRLYALADGASALNCR